MPSGGSLLVSKSLASPPNEETAQVCRGLNWVNVSFLTYKDGKTWTRGEEPLLQTQRGMQN